MTKQQPADALQAAPKPRRGAKAEPRLAQALRDNLARRKQQARAREASAGDTNEAAGSGPFSEQD